jgi:periplasmic divalent cation tolerance protein
VPDIKSAEMLSSMLLTEKLVACANILPVKSMYFWEKRLMNDEEFVILAKTLPNRMDKIESLITHHHPYEIPLIGSWVMEVNETYFDWVRTQLD